MLDRRAFLLGGAAIGLAACRPDPMLPDDIPFLFNVAPDGIHLSDSDLRIDFGRAEQGVVAAMTKLMFEPPESSVLNAECGAGPIKTVTWKEGLSLLFQNGAFRGWSVNRAVFITTNGYSTGMTRRMLRDRGLSDFQQTTLGSEFEVGGIYGLIEETGPNAPVTVMWAGVSCFFR